METITTTGISELLLKTMGEKMSWPDPHSTMRHFLLLKYLQVLALPLKNGPLSGIGSLASLYTALLLNSPRASRKASGVLLGQLARADLLLLLHWGLGALRPAFGVSEKALERLEHGLLASYHLAGLLLLSCISLEAQLVCWKPTETRSLRTVHCARLATSTIWAVVAMQFVILQTSEYDFALKDQGGLLTVLTIACNVLAPFIQILVFCVIPVLWVANTWTCYTIFCNKPQRKQSCFH